MNFSVELHAIWSWHICQIFIGYIREYKQLAPLELYLQPGYYIKSTKKYNHLNILNALRVRCEQRKSLASENRSKQNIFEAREAESGSACDCASERDHLFF